MSTFQHRSSLRYQTTKDTMTKMTSFKKPQFSDVIDNLGFGKAQIRALLSGGAVLAADGAELLLISAVTREVKEEWDLNSTERGLIVSAVFVGMLIGNLLSGFCADRFGRRSPITVSFCGVFIFSMLSIFAYGPKTMMFIRFFVGASCGIGLSAWVTLAAEIAPSEKRLHMNSLGFAMFTLGEIWSVGLIYVNDPQMKSLDWRFLIAGGALPSLVLGFGSYLCLTESPSWLATRGKEDEAKDCVKKLYEQQGFPEEEIPQDFHLPPQPKAEAGWKKIDRVIGHKMIFTTLTMCFSCFTLNILFYGGLYSLPQLLPEIDSGMSPAAGLLMAALQELPGYAIGLLIAQNMSRRLGMGVYLAGNLAAQLLFTYAAAELLGEGMGGEAKAPAGYMQVALQVGMQSSKAFTAMGFLVVYSYTSEVFSHSVRASGTGLCLAMGRFGSITCPLIYENLVDLTGSKLSFLHFMNVCAAFNIILICLLTVETAGKPLKADDEHDEIEPLMDNKA